MVENRKYLIFGVSEIDKVDFSEISETSAQTLRRSIDQTKAVIKWDVAPLYAPCPPESQVITNGTAMVPQYDSNHNITGFLSQPYVTTGCLITPPQTGISNWQPNFVNNLTTKEGPYEWSEIISILTGSEWTAPFPNIKK
jgi:hypothetical protein